MTPLAGLVIALIAGWIMRDARTAVAVAIVPFLAVTAGQTWGIADGRGISPPSTVWPVGPAISYYVVQVLILAVTLGVAAQLGALRARAGTDRDGAAGAGRRTAIAAAILVPLTAVYLAAAWLASAPVLHHSADGSPPAEGLIGMALGIIALVTLGVLLLRGRRTAAAGRAARTGAGPQAVAADRAAS
jgi:hypothetical protein